MENKCILFDCTHDFKQVSLLQNSASGNLDSGNLAFKILQIFINCTPMTDWQTKRLTDQQTKGQIDDPSWITKRDVGKLCISIKPQTISYASYFKEIL